MMKLSRGDIEQAWKDTYAPDDWTHIVAFANAAVTIAAALEQPGDADLRLELFDATDPRQFVTKLHAYYRDAGRAARTSRELMYLHLGMATGMIARLVDSDGSEVRELRSRGGGIERPKR